MPASHETHILSLLKNLYPQADTTAILQQLMQRIHAAKVPSTRREGLFSEKDVTLITYGDTLLRDSEAPLKTLHQFIKTRLDGVVSTVHILPFYPYSSDDGFSVMDYYAVNPDLGTWEDVHAISEDVDLMFDAVINHMSAKSAWFQDFLEGDPEFQDFFLTESPETDLSSVTRPRTSPLLTAFTRTDGETVHVWTTFSADQVDIDFRAPETMLRIMDVLLFYVEQGASVIRLDAIAYAWKIVGTACIHLPEVHALVQLIRAALNAAAPNLVIITETNVPHAENVSYFGDGTDEAQMVYNFTLPPLLFHTFLAQDVTKFRAWVNSLTTPSEQTTFFNFTASHDGIGVRPVEDILSAEELQAMIDHVEAVDGRVSYKTNSDGSRSPYELNVTYVDALTDPTEGVAMQARRFILSQTIAMSLAGVPAVYIHSLLGSRNDIAGRERTGHNRSINREKLKFTQVETALDDADSFRAQVFSAYADRLNKRRQQAAFHPNAAQQALNLGNDKILGLLRTAANGESILGIFNISGTAQSVDLSAYLTGAAADLISGETVTASLTLEPYQACWIKR